MEKEQNLFKDEEVLVPTRVLQVDVFTASNHSDYVRCWRVVAKTWLGQYKTLGFYLNKDKAVKSANDNLRFYRSLYCHVSVCKACLFV